MKDIISDIVKVVGIYEKVFGKLLDKLIYDNELKDIKTILREVYTIKDVDAYFQDKIVYKNFEDLSKIIFRFYDQKQEERGVIDKFTNGSNKK